MEQLDTTYLKPGDQDQIAKALGVTPGAVSQTVRGISSSTRIKYAVEKLNTARKEAIDNGLGALCESIKREATKDVTPPKA